MQLAAVPLDRLSDTSAYLYKTDTGWSQDHTQATPIFTDTPACDGEVSVEQLGAGGPYLMAYVCGQPEQTDPLHLYVSRRTEPGDIRAIGAESDRAMVYCQCLV